MHLDLRFPMTEAAPSAARGALDELKEFVGPGLLEDLRLLVSELITNSIKHADSPADAWIRLQVELSPTRIRVEVSDLGEGFEPSVAAKNGSDESGWGLKLVARLADRWGVMKEEHTTTVWLEVDRFGDR